MTDENESSKQHLGQKDDDSNKKEDLHEIRETMTDGKESNTQRLGQKDDDKEDLHEKRETMTDEKESHTQHLGQKDDDSNKEEADNEEEGEEISEFQISENETKTDKAMIPEDAMNLLAPGTSLGKIWEIGKSRELNSEEIINLDIINLGDEIQKHRFPDDIYAILLRGVLMVRDEKMKNIRDDGAAFLVAEGANPEKVPEEVRALLGGQKQDEATDEDQAAGDLQAVGAGEESAEAGEKPAEAGEESAEAGEKPAEAGEESAEAGEKPAEAAEESAEAGEQSAEAVEEPPEAGDEDQA